MSEEKTEVKPQQVKVTVLYTYTCPGCGVDVGAPDESELTAEKPKFEVKAETGKCKHCEADLVQPRLVTSIL